MCLLAAAVTIVGFGSLAAAQEAEGPGRATVPSTFAGEYGVMLRAVRAAGAGAARGDAGVRQRGDRPDVAVDAAPGRAAGRPGGRGPVVVTGVGVLLALVADAWPCWSTRPDVVVRRAADSLARVAAVLVAGSVLAVGSGCCCAVPRGALADGVPDPARAAVPAAVVRRGRGWRTSAELLPGSGAIWILIGEPEMTAAKATALLVGWSGAALLGGGWSLLRRDAG